MGLLAERTGIDVVADLRSRDVAPKCGQGAHRAAAFHRAVFARSGEAVAVLNLGGIAQPHAARPDGTGARLRLQPGQRELLDHWGPAGHRSPCNPSIVGGQWAASGRVDDAAVRWRSPLLRSAAAEEHRPRPVPCAMAGDNTSPRGLAFAAADVQATLAELTAWGLPRSCASHLADARGVAGVRRRRKASTAT